jgi:hypothetical protein
MTFGDLESIKPIVLFNVFNAIWSLSSLYRARYPEVERDIVIEEVAAREEAHVTVLLLY